VTSMCLKTQSIIKLNVGGKRFTTSLTSLRVADEGSVLAAMFNGRYSLKKDADGYFFIDRDGSLFEHILNFLRDGAKRVPLFSSIHIAQLVRREAQYYGLTSLSNLIKAPHPVPFHISRLRELKYKKMQPWRFFEIYQGKWYRGIVVGLKEFEVKVLPEEWGKSSSGLWVNRTSDYIAPIGTHTKTKAADH